MQRGKNDTDIEEKLIGACSASVSVNIIYLTGQPSSTEELGAI